MTGDKAAPMVVTEQASATGGQLVTMAEPRSVAAEQFRILARRLEKRVARGLVRIAVTSAVAGEGRSTCAANLAVALAMGGRKRVALVDADVAAPALDRLLGVTPPAGLVEVVAGHAAVDDALVRIGAVDLFFLSAAAGLSAAPHEIFAAPRLGALLMEMGERFDVVVLDGPPLLPSADLLALSTAFGEPAGGLLMVVRAGGPSRDLIEQALAMVPDMPLLGWVLSGCPPRDAASRTARRAARRRPSHAQPVAGAGALLAPSAALGATKS